MEKLLKSFLEAYIHGHLSLNEMAEAINAFGVFHRYINNRGVRTIHVSIKGTYYSIML